MPIFNSSQFSNPFNSSIDLFCSFWTLFTSLSVFLVLFLLVFYKYSLLCDWYIYPGHLIALKCLFFVLVLFSFLLASTLLYYTKTKKIIFLKKLIILTVRAYMSWLCILLYTLIHNFGCKCIYSYSIFND